MDSRKPAPLYKLETCTCHCGCRRTLYAAQWSGRCVVCRRADDPSSGYYRKPNS